MFTPFSTEIYCLFVMSCLVLFICFCGVKEEADSLTVNHVNTSVQIK